MVSAFDLKKTSRNCGIVEGGCDPWSFRCIFQHAVSNAALMNEWAGNTGIAVLITAAILNWQLMLVMLGCIPFIGASVGILTQMMSTTTQEGNDHYSKAGGVATEVGFESLKRALESRTTLNSYIYSPLLFGD